MRRGVRIISESIIIYNIIILFGSRRRIYYTRTHYLYGHGMGDIIGGGAAGSEGEA